MTSQKPIVSALSIALLAILACNFMVGPSQISSQAQSKAVAAVALRLDGSGAQLSSFVGPGTSTWALEPGSYRVSAVNQSGMTIVFPRMDIADVPLIWPADFRSAGGTMDTARAAAIKTLARFLVDAQSAKLAALEHSSAGFTVPLFTAQPGQADLDDLYSRYAAITAEQSSVMTSLDAILQSPRSGLLPPKMGSPRRDWHDSLKGFFGYAGGAGSRARDRILMIAENLSPADQADAFDVVRPAFTSGAANFDELAVKLQNGELDTQAAQIESDMRNSVGFGAAASEAGVSVAQVVHQEGGELVSKGADLQADVVKQVLGDVFPDISQGFDLADKANEWADYVQSVYKNPLVVAEGEARGAIQEKIKERVLEHLHECCKALEADVAEAIADNISEQAVSAVPSLVENIQATQTALAAQVPSVPAGTPSSDGHARVDLRDTFHEVLTYPQTSQVDFSTSMALTADKDAAHVTGALDGTGTYVIDVPCSDLLDASVIYERGAASYRFTYSAAVNTAFDTHTGEFSAPLAPSGKIEFIQMTKPFTDSHCTGMNTDLNVSFPFTGAGTIQGVIAPDGTAQVTTAWSFLEQGSVKGSWSGQGQVTP
jgi:hypothetical protein